MIDITEIEVRELFVHRVGNQLRNEGISYSESHQEIPLRDKLPLLQFLFGHADRLNLHSFTHSVSPELNTLCVLATNLCAQREPFKKVARDIAAHLYSVSKHPRIKAGNLFVGLFDGVRFGGKSHSVLGIFKSDTVDAFIKVEVERGKASLKVEQGAAITSLDKIGIVVLPQRGNTEEVFAACARGEDAVFWNEHFFQIEPTQSPKASTKACLDMCRMFAKEKGDQFDDPERILFLNRSLEFFENSDQYNEEKFSSVFTSKSQEIEFNQFKADRAAQDKQKIAETFKIEKIVVRKERSKFLKNVKLDRNIEIRLRFKNHQEMRRRVEQGFDEVKGLSFYKLYYSTRK